VDEVRKRELTTTLGCVKLLEAEIAALKADLSDANRTFTVAARKALPNPGEWADVVVGVTTYRVRRVYLPGHGTAPGIDTIEVH
jgi:hypothetical protein